ncbi:hypothetical protein AAMO2058_000914600 [Amorphochlora amoebiformis]
MVSRTGTVLYLNPDGMLWEGYLKKTGKFNKSRQKRYFRLVQKPLQLWYYTSDKTAKPKGQIDMFDSKGRPNQIIIKGTKMDIKTEGRVYHIEAESEEEMKTLNTVIAINRSKELAAKKKADLKPKEGSSCGSSPKGSGFIKV